MCQFIGSYEDSKLLKRRMNKLAEEKPEAGESRRATLSGLRIQVTTKECSQICVSSLDTLHFYIISSFL